MGCLLPVFWTLRVSFSLYTFPILHSPLKMNRLYLASKMCTAPINKQLTSWNYYKEAPTAELTT